MSYRSTLSFTVGGEQPERDRLRAASAGTNRWKYHGYRRAEDELVRVRVGDLRVMLKL